MACSSATVRRPHALAIPVALTGHSNPLMRFCEKLASQEGFIITFLSIDVTHTPELQQLDDSSEEKSLQTAAASYIRTARIRLPPLPKLSELAGRYLQTFYPALHSLAPEIERLLFKLQRQEPPVTCIISDLLMTQATQSIADKFKLPRFAFSSNSHSVLLSFHHILQGALPLQEVLEALAQWELLKESIIREGLQGLPPALKVGDLMYTFNESPFCYKLMLEALEETRKKSQAIVVNSFQEIEVDALKVDIGLPVYAVGPLFHQIEEKNVRVPADAISGSLLEEDNSCLSWLDKQPPSSVLYISFGSFAVLSTAQFEELVAGLISSQQRFLWVFRPDLVTDAQQGLDASKEEMLLRSNGRGYVTSWAPQVKVLKHPATYGFLTHSGWNSVLEALAMGIPMLCFPFAADHFMDTRLVVEEWKVGLRFKEDKGRRVIGREEVKGVIKALMEGEEGRLLHTNAKRLKEACEQACSEGGAAFKNVRALVMSLESQS